MIQEICDKRHGCNHIVTTTWFPTPSLPLAFLGSFFSCGHATLKEALSIRPSVDLSISPFVCGDQAEKWKKRAFCVCLCVKRGGWMKVGCPCPPVCNDIVTPRQLFILHFPKCQVRVCTLHKGGDARTCSYFVTDIRTSNSLHVHLSFQHLEKNWRKNK